MTHEKRVPLAWPVLWRRIRSQVIPFAAFMLAMSGSGWLWQWHGNSVQGVGEVSGPRVDITSPTAGLVIALPHETRGQWTVFDHVRAGDIIARIDDQQLEASKSLLRRDIKQLTEQVNQFQVDEANAGNAEVAAFIQRARDYELSRLQSLEQLLAAAPKLTPNEIHDLSTAAPEIPELIPTVLRDGLVRLRESRRGIDLRWEELNLRDELLEIPAPISGTLVNLYCWPGQIVHSGGLIATIAADHGQHIVGYLPEESAITPRIGMQVTMRARGPRAPRFTSEIEEIGMQIERIPSHQRAIATTPQWGLPVRIKLPSEAALRPGALVDVVFHRSTAQ